MPVIRLYLSVYTVLRNDLTTYILFVSELIEVVDNSINRENDYRANLPQQKFD